MTFNLLKKCGVKLIYHTLHGEISTYNSFTKISNNLPCNFVRCHKSFIANINNIANISLSENLIVFNNNETCFIGPKYKNSFMEVIDYDSSFQ